jgi:hypothetical protein
MKHKTLRGTIRYTSTKRSALQVRAEIHHHRQADSTRIVCPQQIDDGPM